MQQILTLLSAIKRGTLHWGATTETMTVLTHSSEYLLSVFKCLRWSVVCLLCRRVCTKILVSWPWEEGIGAP